MFYRTVEYYPGDHLNNNNNNNKDKDKNNNNILSTILRGLKKMNTV